MLIRWFILQIILFCSIWPSRLVGQTDLSGRIVAETLINPIGRSEFTAIWWIPLEFWDQTWPVSDDLEHLEFRNRTMIALKGKEMVALVPDSDTEIDFASLKCQLKGFGSLQLIEPIQLDGDLKNFVERVKPMLSNVMEAQPSNINLYFFDIPSNYLLEGHADSKKETSLILQYHVEEYSWNYPPLAIRMALVCPEDEKLMEPGWIYCPWHGALLIQPPAR